MAEVERKESEQKRMVDKRANASEIHSHSEKEAVYTMVKGSKSSDDVILIETS
ncbi:hypothetical protein HPP92_028408 [Vanilla planifolia]|uniref:Uncharacterized protein n=1 Tax=Vanilla planifolia TaxID=51239 RepID=A0A835U5V0_VANPL|nr:hypothetical protein HPP92_028408 [Vanilla planifolia]